MAVPSVLLIPRELDFVVPELADCYRVLKLWEAPQPEDLAQVGALICLGHQSPDTLLEQLPRLGLIACFTTGYEAIDVAALTERGVQVSHAPGVTAEPVAEFALGLMLASFRNIVTGMAHLREGRWIKDGAPLLGRSLLGAQVGIVGLGAIGQALARRCEALGMAVSWWGPRAKPDAPWPRSESLERLAREADVLAVCTAANADNVGLISSEIIDAIGPQALLVNVVRGQLVDEDSLIDALKVGRIGGAALAGPLGCPSVDRAVGEATIVRLLLRFGSWPVNSQIDFWVAARSEACFFPLADQLEPGQRAGANLCQDQR